MVVTGHLGFTVPEFNLIHLMPVFLGTWGRYEHNLFIKLDFLVVMVVHNGMAPSIRSATFGVVSSGSIRVTWKRCVNVVTPSSDSDNLIRKR